MILKFQNIQSDFYSQQILCISFWTGKWAGREGDEQSLSLGSWARRPACQDGCFPVVLTPLAGLLSSSAFFLLSPSHCGLTADELGQMPSWLGHERMVKTTPGLSLNPWWWKDSVNLNNFSQESSSLCLLKSKSFSNLKIKIQNFWFNSRPLFG